ncbi:MAG: T9SS type A sorting domain-containing protein [Bacteroidetes bacterium]|nr:T9SS type A sorting domain-containing protein [Bacteroidota bacterium]
MKAIFLIPLLLTGSYLLSQNAIKFDYDAGGNITQRYVQIVNLKLKNNNQTKDSVLNFSVYPNPAKDNFYIEGPLAENTKEAKVLLYDINGAIVKEDFYYGTKKSFPLNGYITGIYFLEIKYSKKQSSTFRILITE